MSSRTHMSPFSLFPAELIDEIAQCSQTSELLSLCRTSRQFNPIATRLLYRTVILQAPSKAIRCCRTIVARPTAARAVRRFSIEFSCRRLLSNFFTLTASAISHATNLSYLDISPALPLLPLLQHIQLPRLTECTLPYTPSIAPFLFQHHRTIQYLVIQPPGAAQVFSAELFANARDKEEEGRFTPMHLPALASFVGPSTIASYIIPGSNAHHLTIFWDPHVSPAADHADGVLAALAQTRASTGVSVLDNLTLGWDAQVLHAVAEHLPGVVMLRMRNVSPLVFKCEITAFLATVESTLLSFPSLINIAISMVFNALRYDLSDLDREFDTVTRWGKLVPGLVVCTLPSGTKWSRSSGRSSPNVWFPDSQGNLAALKSEWLLRAILSVRYPLEMYEGVRDTEGRGVVGRLSELMEQGVEYPVLVMDGHMDGGAGGEGEEEEEEEEGEEYSESEGESEEEREGLNGLVPSAVDLKGV